MAEEPLTSLAPVVSSLVPEIRPLLDIPYVFFGHSMGGLIAFELARELRRANYPQPAILLLSGRPAPHLASDHQPLHTMPTSDFLRAIRELGGTPPEIFENAQILELVLPTLRADLAVTETYAFKPDQPLDAPFSLFYGWDDASATEADMHPWCRHTTGGFSLRGLPGGHFFPQTARSQLLAAISADLAPLLL